ncbi:MAG: single-stranded-DNA-specific exonuclease RecJ [Planctomycetes bacterium]|nr:single-stranded-DNA-specific exonuclease RecJ [Planctomycetota bacterium]
MRRRSQSVRPGRPRSTADHRPLHQRSHQRFPDRSRLRPRTEARIVLASLSTPRRRWNVHPARPAERAELGRALGISDIAAQCLLNRGVSGESEAREFLRGSLATLLRPEDLPDMPAAVARIRRAIADRERICVWGDYDVDGVCGTAVMVKFLRMLGGDVIPHLPNRTGSGYGFHWPTMQQRIAQGVSLFISVDHGSAAVEAITNCQAAGVDVVVADHHEMAPTLPPAVAVINPKRSDSKYGFTGLCGTGVAMKLAWAVAQDLSPGARVSDSMREFLLDALGLAVLGTVADVVPLRGENRAIVRHGLQVLGSRPSPGLSALLDVSKARAPLRASDIGFKLGPRLNAAGRMGSAELALDLLLTDDPVRAREIALRLDAENERRRTVERGVAEEARQRVLDEIGPAPRGGIALMSENWHQGVIGIVAARLVDEFHVPVVIVGVQQGVGRGSARSVKGFELHTALAACGEHLVAHGGHAGAAGLTIEPGRFSGFRDAFARYVEERLDDDTRGGSLTVDADAHPREITAEVCASLDRLEPFGEGNPPPVLALRGVSVMGVPRRMGAQNEHVAFHAGRDGNALRCVAFRNAAKWAPLLAPGSRLDIAVTPQVNSFRGNDEAEGAVVDIRPSGDPA